MQSSHNYTDAADLVELFTAVINLLIWKLIKITEEKMCHDESTLPNISDSD